MKQLTIYTFSILVMIVCLPATGFSHTQEAIENIKRNTLPHRLACYRDFITFDARHKCIRYAEDGFLVDGQITACRRSQHSTEDDGILCMDIVAGTFIYPARINECGHIKPSKEWVKYRDCLKKGPQPR